MDDLGLPIWPLPQCANVLDFRSGPKESAVTAELWLFLSPVSSVLPPLPCQVGKHSRHKEVGVQTPSGFAGGDLFLVQDWRRSRWTVTCARVRLSGSYDFCPPTNSSVTELKNSATAYILCKCSRTKKQYIYIYKLYIYILFMLNNMFIVLL